MSWSIARYLPSAHLGSMGVLGVSETWAAVMVQGTERRVSLDLGKSMKARMWRSHSVAVMVTGSS